MLIYGFTNNSDLLTLIKNVVSIMMATTHAAMATLTLCSHLLGQLKEGTKLLGREEHMEAAQETLHAELGPRHLVALLDGHRDRQLASSHGDGHTLHLTATQVGFCMMGTKQVLWRSGQREGCYDHANPLPTPKTVNGCLTCQVIIQHMTRIFNKIARI